MGVDWFVNQNSILWERIRGYERKLNDLNQTKKDLQQQYFIDEKKLDKHKKDNDELEQQCNTLAKDSRKTRVNRVKVYPNYFYCFKIRIQD